MKLAKAFCNRKLYSTNASADHHVPSLVSYYFSLLDSTPNQIHLRHLHARLLRTSIYENVVLSSKLILMYSKHNRLSPDALSVFFHMPHRNIYSWNNVIGEFSRSGSPEKAIDLFLQMRKSEVQPDFFTLPPVLRACTSSGLTNCGFSMHGFCVKAGMERSLFVASALVSMYVTFGKTFDARVLFDEIPERDQVLWTSMLAGYAQNEEPVMGLSVFREMAGAGVEFDAAIMVSLLSVCGQLGWLKHGKSVHGWCIRKRIGVGLTLGNAIVDMYVKCAASQYGHIVFARMSVRDVISWSSLILGYGLGGCVDLALILFDQMRVQRIKPNDVTFLGVLSACTHGGLVESAQSYFNMMKDCGVIAEIKHYACMVDCLARAGLLVEAERLVEEMPVQPDEAVLGALIGGCRVHGNLEMGERIAKRLIELAPMKTASYVHLANIYADAGKFDDAERVWAFTKLKNMTKDPGCSLIESNDCFQLPHCY